MTRILALVALAAALVAVPAGAAVKTKTYKGQATGLDGKFKYGKVTIKRKGAKVTYVEIKAVTATCSGQPLLRTIVFKDGSKDMKVIAGSSKIKGGKMSVTFLPVADIEDAQTRITMKFSGSKVSGDFEEYGICNDAGKFKAKG